MYLCSKSNGKFNGFNFDCLLEKCFIKILHYVVSGLLLHLYSKLGECFAIVWLDIFAIRLTNHFGDNL